MTTTWKIKKIERQLPEGVVINVRYLCTSTEDGISMRKVGKVLLEGDVDDPDFIPYADLTEEVVIGWVKSSLGETKVAKIEADLNQQVLNQAEKVESARTRETGLPWA